MTASEHPVSVPVPRRPRHRHGVLAASALLAVGALVLSACDGSGASGGDEVADKNTSGTSGKSGIEIKVSARDGATDAGLNTGVSVSGGRLTEVRLVRVDSGVTVKGSIAGDGTSWKPAVPLERGTRYQLVANAKDGKGHSAAEKSTFTTVSAKNSFTASYTPDGGTTVGVGMPVSFTFDKPISNRKDVESHITVSAGSGQKVVGHWFGAKRLDFRPQEYWKAGSTVTMKIDLDGVKGGEGLTGVQSKAVTFTVGRSQVSTVDLNTQTMTVVRDGKPVKSLPVSGGSPKHPTYNGQMVISEKLVQTRMNGSTVGFNDPGNTYDIPDVPHAMRLSATGTFLHGNYWSSPSVFGRSGTSHGCIGLQDHKGGGGDTPAKWFFEQSLAGDVVIVKNSPEQTVKPDNGLNGWNLSWSDWQAGSAL
ncbi:L,D-transpeptidase [Streptomyces sp. S186]|uniref:L,D-transpeptidase n=1 Tax=Streptomyces sp. S186 TaxID=3434395 RepID=UPI003F672B9B